MPTVFEGSPAYPDPSPGPVVTIGNFDGVHLGHRELVARTVARARAASVPACAYTFDPAPASVLRPEHASPPIQSVGDRVALLGTLGVHHVVVEPFDRTFASQEPRWFADQVIGARLGASAVVVGWDFRFGRRRAGTVADLQAWLGLPVEQVTALEADGAVISSTRIRGLLRDGDVEAAAVLLARAHTVRGTVATGDQRGRTLGFPTANLGDVGGLLPALGVYAVRVEGLGDGVANLGTRPTFDGHAPVLEIHLLDFDGDLYGRELVVGFVARLRPEARFDGVDALVAAISRDIEAARRVLADA